MLSSNSDDRVRVWPLVVNPAANALRPGAIVLWVALALGIEASVGLHGQWLLGAATWCLLFALARHEPMAVRLQIAIAVGIATAVEFAAAPGLGFYTYRLSNVPAFVPPGHGLVYLGALQASRIAALQRHAATIARVALAVMCVWVAYGILLAERRDGLGALLAVFLIWCLVRGSRPLLYACAFVLASYVELVGTGVGTWTWAVHDPSGFLPAANPPSGIAGCYCVLDALSIRSGRVLAPLLTGIGGKSASSTMPH